MLSLPLVAAALASPLNPWGSATAPGSALVSPYLNLYPDAVSASVYGAAGVSERADVYFGYGEYIPREGPGVGTLEFFPRFFLLPELALSPHVYWTPGVDGVVAAPEVHVSVATERFSFVANAGWRPVVESSGLSVGTVAVFAAPEVELTDWFSAYVEVDPTFSLVGDPVALQVVPGFGMTLDPGARHGISVGLQVPVLPEVATASLGLWYCFTFATESK